MRNCNRIECSVDSVDDDGMYWVLIKSKYVCFKVSGTTQTFISISVLTQRKLNPNCLLSSGNDFGWLEDCGFAVVYLCCKTRGKRKFCNIFVNLFTSVLCAFYALVLCAQKKGRKTQPLSLSFHRHIKSVHFHRAKH